MRRIISSLLALCVAGTVMADEGMWLPSLVSQRIADMQSKGFRLTAEDIYSINQASLKDAVMLFGGGCTGEVVSSKGLVFTNHHCGYGQIQRHSSVDHDYLRDGFWAMNMNEELPNPGLTVCFLDYMDDVTDSVLSGYNDGMSEAQRDSVVSANSKRLIEAATAPGNGLKAEVDALYYGNQYFIFVFREFRDVRLVGAPPSSIGKFGGDTDNWMWPRHTGDFSIFRIYADKDNNPADYHADNIPYTPKRYLKVSAKGVHEGDFTFVYGFPGSTREYITSDQVRFIGEVSDPIGIRLRTKRLDVQRKYMSQDQAVRIMYSSKNASVSNAWKKWQGEAKGIRRMNTVADKLEYEAAFKGWAAGTRFEGVLDSLHRYSKEVEPYQTAAVYYRESVLTIELLRYASSIVKSLSKGDADTSAVLSSTYRDYYMPIDRECFTAMVSEFAANVPAGFLPDFFSSRFAAYDGDAQSWADDLYSASAFTSEGGVRAAISEGRNLEEDQAYMLMDALTTFYDTHIQPELNRINSRITLLYRDYMQGQMEFSPEKTFYPDANLTLRVAYGHVAGYQPADGIYYRHQSTIEGIMQKDNPEIFDYNIPQALRDLYASKNYGQWADENGTIPVCFSATNHTTGGNSGSPVINADGELIGLNFDRVWEGTMSDIVYDPNVCRNICLDVRYLLFIIDRIAHDTRLLDEMDIVR